MKNIKVIISGGGTGGHIYPAVSIANALKTCFPDADILFVGAEGRMEMEKVPAAGYRIIGLPVVGIQRKLTLKNFALPFKLLKSARKAIAIIKEFKPDVVIGVGGYASGPVLWAAQRKKIPTLLQEQNSYAGVTNKILAKKASKICVAYDSMERFFPKAKIIMTGNPVRQDLKLDDGRLRNEAADFFGLDPKKKTILVVGGSLGARTLNQTMMKALVELTNSEVQFIWQTGKIYFEQALAAQNERTENTIKIFDFIYRMDYAFAAADVVVSRAGAGTISELCVVAKPCVFVPSPNVSEDHQTKNAQALVNKNAALMVRDADALNDLIPTVLNLVHDAEKMQELKTNIATLAKPNAADEIVKEVVALANCPQLTTPCAVYFIGIGGIGMSALARYYKHEGMFVAGYDRTPSPLTEALEREGIDIHYEDNINLISPEFLPDNNKYSTNDILVIYTPAVPESHSEWQFFKQHGYQLIKRSAALGYIAAGKITLAVAGTHGKTTTTTLLAHVLKQTSNGCTAFLGGISKNYNSNLLLSASPALVAEADEFDRSFLQLFPHVAVITATDADHLDIYGTHKAVKDAFSAFAAQVKPNGVLILKQGVELPLSGEWESDAHTVYRYALREKCDFYASDIRRLDSGLTQFDIHLPDGVINDCVLGIPGLINVENAIAAVAAAWAYERLTGNDKKITGKGSSLKDALASFAGVQRRFDVQVNTPACTYIDDYAHHPEELRAAITSLREIYPERKITGVFQPHLYTRTRDFAEGFAASLDLLDRLILLDIYPARELPINGVSSQIIFDKMTLENKVLCHKNDLMNLLEKEPLDVLITFGAGDIDRFVPSITELLNRRYNDAR